jgi:hypothetical protein
MFEYESRNGQYAPLIADDKVIQDNAVLDSYHLQQEILTTTILDSKH